MPKQNIDFLVIGAQKSGTTSLFAYMRRHPSLYLPAQKEVNYFSAGYDVHQDIDWYIQAHFAGAGEKKLWGEVSPQYMGVAHAPPRIHAAFPKVKLVAILRNPIDRAYSHYRMLLRWRVETRSFYEIVASQSATPVLSEMALGFDAGDVIGLGLYGQALRRYLRYFDREQILILFQEDLLANPDDVMARLFSFLGVDSTYKPPNIGKMYHVGGVERLPGLPWRLYSWLRSRKILKKAIKRALPYRNLAAAKFWLDQANVKPLRAEGLPPEERLHLKKLFEEDVELLKWSFSTSTPWPEFEDYSEPPR